MATIQQLSLQQKAQIELELRQRGLTIQQPDRVALIADGWRAWVDTLFPLYATAPFAPRHIALWEWFDALAPGMRPRPRVEIWPRGGAKSTTVELGCAWLYEKLTRHFVLYVSGTQPQADKHVQSIGTLLEEVGVDRAVNEYGVSKGWRHQELRAANGFNAIAYGLDVAIRGIKIDQWRPDLIIFDDVDSRHDSPATVKKKIEAITESVLPTGSTDCAVLFVQSRVHKNSIASMLADNKADFLRDREPVVIEKAINDLRFEYVDDGGGAGHYAINAGTATWEGQNLKVCEQQINDWGPGPFKREAQHEVDEVADALWKRKWINDNRIVHDRVPLLIRVVVGVDPPGSSKKTGAEAGIIAVGKDNRQPPHLYVLADASLRGTPDEWAKAVIRTYNAHNADRVIAETNYGGEMVEATIRTQAKVMGISIPYKAVHATRGKAVRAEPVAVATSEGRVHFVGFFEELEDELCTWVPGVGPSPNRLDGLVWCGIELDAGGGGWAAVADMGHIEGVENKWG